MIQRCCKRKKRTCRLLAPAITLLLGAAVFCGPAGAQVVPVDPPAPAPALSLKDVVAPEPTNLFAFLKGDPLSATCQVKKRPWQKSWPSF
jgi:hypothetical protein